jgi:hypothetical protein
MENISKKNLLWEKYITFHGGGFYWKNGILVILEFRFKKSNLIYSLPYLPKAEVNLLKTCMNSKLF